MTMTMTNPITVLLFQAISSYNNAAAATPEKHTLPKALLYTLGTTILATILYKSIKPQSIFLSVLRKPLDFIFGKPATATGTSSMFGEETPSLSFEDKYFKEYDEHIATQQADDVRKECLENMYSSTVRETINEFYGDVIMCYDHATLSFVYYARTANIPYKYLETISRKYMIETNAPSEIHVDIRNEYNKAKERRNNPPPPPPPPPASDLPPATETNVFVKLKSYNTASNLSLHKAINDRNAIASAAASASSSASSSATPASASSSTAFTATASSSTAFTASASSSTASAILREKANRYSYRGKISEFDEHHKTFLAERRTTTTHEALHTLREGYADFKKKQMSAL